LVITDWYGTGTTPVLDTTPLALEVSNICLILRRFCIDVVGIMMTVKISKSEHDRARPFDGVSFGDRRLVLPLTLGELVACDNDSKVRKVSRPLVGGILPQQVGFYFVGIHPLLREI
jgi:hypothetical protein